MKANERTRAVRVGRPGDPRAVTIGAGAPCAVQSMLNAPAEDAAANIAQCEQLAAAGCEIARMSVPSREALASFERVALGSPLPVVADIHFRAELAVAAAKAGASALRINPGNIGGLAACDPVIEAAGEAGIPIRIGVNAGSLDKELKAREDLSLAEKLSASAADYVAYFEGRGFKDLVVSAKAHDVTATIATYRLLSERLPEIPLHIGITEAGTPFQGIIKSAAGLGILLEEGIGDTMRISLTGPITEEVRAAWTLLAALGLRRRGPELVSCPTCGRTQVDLIGLAEEVERRMAANPELANKTLTVAVMGCVVNGPGEAADADIGVACGAGSGIIFAHGKTLRKVAEDAIVDALIEEIEKL